MIGHYLLTLTPEQEDRVLIRPFVPVGLGSSPDGACCLVMTATGNRDQRVGANDEEIRYGERRRRVCYDAPGWRYEWACDRFGTARVNAAIRNRILSNRARRALAGVRELVETA